jgi:hypothetical protein
MGKVNYINANSYVPFALLKINEGYNVNVISTAIIPKKKIQ